MATYNLARQLRPDIKQIAITCNKEGALAKAARADKNALYLELPEETNDKSLVMTSSFTTMALTALGLGYLDNPAQFSSLAQSAAKIATGILQDQLGIIKTFADQPFTRACFLGSGPLNGTMQECHLKLQEMTEGQVVSMFNSFVGLRHGPQVFVNKNCAVIAALSSDPYVRKYELDMLKELRTKRQGMATLLIADRITDELKALSTAQIQLQPGEDDGVTIGDDFRVLTDTLIGQLLGTFACLRCGLNPDNPSTSGTITRVVQGVTIHPYPS
jgi:tagatose-6-phosphate ketose/aldose isomerase